MEIKQVENLKLNVTNIKSSLIESNKELIKLNKERISLFNRQEKRQTRKNAESKIESPIKSAFSKIKNLSRPIISKSMGFFGRIVNFFGAILLGYAADNLPAIIKKLTEIYETTKPIWKGVLETLKIVGKGIIFAFDGLITFFDSDTAETNLKKAQDELEALDKEIDINEFDFTTVPTQNTSITEIEINQVQPAPQEPNNTKISIPTTQKTRYNSKPIKGMNRGGIVRKNHSKPSKPSSTIAKNNPIRLFPQASNSFAYSINLYKKNVEKFKDTVGGIGNMLSGGQRGNVSSRLSSLNIGSGGGLLKNLSEEDWNHLGYIVSGEAERGTDDEYGVVASVLNRVASTEWPNTIEGVIYQSDQYEAITKGIASHDPELVEQLKSEEGQAKIIEALKKLKGRTNFKGTSMYHNYVPSEDIKFSARGNFYHYSWQTGRNSKKPTGFKDVNFQKFIKKDNVISPLSSNSSQNQTFILMPIVKDRPVPVPVLLNNSGNGTSSFTDNFRRMQSLTNRIP